MKETILTFAKKLIEIPSTSDNPKALRDVLRICTEELKDFTVEMFESDGTFSLLFYTTKTRPKEFKLLLNAHLDVVPAQITQFVPTEKDGKLFGRGANDMKASAAVLIHLFKQMAKHVDYPLGLQLVTDEEIGGFHGAKYQLEQGVRTKFILAGEPTDLGINTKAKGIMWVDITATGKTAHGAYPWNGDNAVLKMQTFLENLKQTFPQPTEEVWKTTVTVSAIQTSNSTYNKVPQDCRAQLDIRYVPEEKETIEKQIRSLLPDGVHMHIHAKEPAHHSSETSKYIESLQSAITEVTGTSARIITKHGGSDVRFYTESGAEGITFGPTGGGLHSDTEWTSIKGLENYYAILNKFLLSLNK